jgi:hypothetical protein
VKFCILDEERDHTHIYIYIYIYSEREREERVLDEKRILRTLFGAKRKNITSHWKKFILKISTGLYSSPYRL